MVLVLLQDHPLNGTIQYLENFYKTHCLKDIFVQIVNIVILIKIF